jgi:hypothetical protein
MVEQSNPFPAPEAVVAGFRELARRVAQEEIKIALEALPNRSLPLPAASWPRPAAVAGYPPVVYISGPMRGYPELNFPAFYAAEKYFEDRGYKVLNPARMDQDSPGQQTVEHYVRRDISAILKSDYIALLHGWERSFGASAEAAVAAWLGRFAFFESAEGVRGPERLRLRVTTV